MLVLALGACYSLTPFRWPMAPPLLLSAPGILGMDRSRAMLRARMADEGIEVAPLMEALARCLGQAGAARIEVWAISRALLAN